MKKILRQTKTLLLAAVIAISGCTSVYDDLTLQVDGEGTSVSFSFDVASITSATEEDYSAATRATEEEEIANLWVVQFDSNGDFVKSEYLSDASSNDDGSYTFRVDFSTSEIVFLANTCNSDLIIEATTLSSLNALTYAVMAHNEVLGDGKYCIMNGSASVSTLTSTATNQITMLRNAVKVTIKIENNLSEDDWKLLSVETLNIQDRSYYIPEDYSDAETFPETSSVVDYTWSSDEVALGTGEEGLTFYLPINKRGTIDTNTSKYDKADNALDDATAINVKFYSTADPFSGVSFTYYLGADLIENYNLLGNCSYSYTFTLNGLGVGDSRVAAYEVEVTIEDYTLSNDSNCYILHPIAGVLEAYIPIEGRINDFWTTYEETPANQLSTTSASTWDVDILWSDIPGVTAQTLSSTEEATTSGGFSAQRVTDGYSSTTNQTALKVTLSPSFNTSSMHGNVVVGIRNTDYSEGQDNYLWSWHFWITDYDPDGTRTSSSTHGYAGEYVWTVTGGEVVRLPGSETTSYDIWTSTTSAYYDKYMMDRPIGAITTAATAHTSNRGVLYYQYGRKDPFTLWPSGTYTPANVSGNATDIKTMKGSVQSPTIFDESWDELSDDNSGTYTSTGNVWNDPNQKISLSATVVGGKSIFDPSPLGWKVPARYTWTYISTNYVSVETAGLFSSSYGLYMGDSSATIDSYYAYYPASGRLNYTSGQLSYGGTYGYCWSGSPQSATFGYNMNFNSTYLYTQSYINRGYGFLVVPIQE